MNKSTIASSPALRSEKSLVDQFDNSVSTKSKIDMAWTKFIAGKRAEELGRIISEEGLNASETQLFMENTFQSGAIQTTGTAIVKILPPVSKFSPGNNYETRKREVLARLEAFFERFLGLI